jgi:hypothetical protein
MTAELTVIGVGCELDRLFADQRPALPIPVAPRREDMRDLFDAINGPVRGGQRVIVIAGDWLSAEALSRLSTVRSLLQTEMVAIHLTSLPPLATSVLAAAAAALAESAVSAGALAGALGEITEQLTVMAWTASVAGLQHEGVSLLDHARSALPWSSFAVGLTPQSFVQPLSANDVALDLAPAGEEISLLLAPGAKAEDADIQTVLDTVVPALGAAQMRQLTATMHGGDWWGTSRLVEIVGLPMDLQRLAELTLPRDVRPCRWCDEPIAVLPCPFCGESAGRRSGRAGTLHPGQVPAGAVSSRSALGDQRTGQPDGGEQ